MIKRTNLDGSRVATFSEDGRYRYELLIRWDATKPLLASVGVNPSLASHLRDDPTVNRDIERASRIGCGAILKLNLFAVIATEPKNMKLEPDPYGEWRDVYEILKSAQIHAAQMIVACWGNHGAHLARAAEFRAVCESKNVELHKYLLTKANEPGHPLYLPYSLLPTPYVWSNNAR